MDARRPERAPVVVVERLHLALDEAANRRRQFRFHLRQRCREHPLPVFLLDDLTPPQIAQQVGYEQGIAFGTPMDEGREIRREPMARKLQPDVSVDCRFVEKPRRHVAAQVARHEIELQRQERVARLRELGRLVGRDDEQPPVVEAAREISDQIDRRGIWPMHVVEDEDDGVQPGDFVEERRHSSFKRSCDPPAVAAARRSADDSFSGAGMICAYQLGASILKRQLGVVRRRRGRRLRNERVERRERGGGGEGMLAGDQLVEHDARGKDV
ncbi:MAG TPA: hypothetical protein VH679_07605, partial [Vicinamibacterales bacterium]